MTLPQLQQRLAELNAQYAAGQKKLQELESQMSNLRDTLQRIRGAIEFLEQSITEASQNQTRRLP